MPLPIARNIALTQVPVVDLTPLRTGNAAARQVLAREIAEASVELGFFYVVNHGIASEKLNGMLATAEAFFDLPLDAKMEVALSKATNYRGFVPLKVMAQRPEWAGSQEEVKGNLYEAFQIHTEFAPDDPDVLAGKPLHSGNRWPSAMPALREKMLAYFNVLDPFAHEILRLFALGLDLPEDTFEQFFQKPMMQLRLLHYPPQDPSDPGDNLGLRPHTDSGALAILAQDEVGGLEILTRSDEWIKVPPIEDSYVINIGEMMKVWTDGIFMATPHRVVNMYGDERYSVPFFATPDFEAEIKPLVENPDRGNEPVFKTSVNRERPIKCGEILVPLYDRIWPVPA